MAYKITRSLSFIEEKNKQSIGNVIEVMVENQNENYLYANLLSEEVDIEMKSYLEGNSKMQCRFLLLLKSFETLECETKGFASLVRYCRIPRWCTL